MKFIRRILSLSIVVAILVSMGVGTYKTLAQENINSRFTDASVTYKAVTATTITGTTIVGTTLKIGGVTFVANDVSSNILAGTFQGIASAFSPSITLRANTGGAGNDSAMTFTFSSGMPVQTFYSANGNGVYTQSVNNSDVGVFAGAAGGYTFDGPLSATTIGGTAATLTEASTVAAGLSIRANAGGAGADSALIVTFASGCPVLTFGASSTGVFALTVTTADVAAFSGETGGYTFHAVIDGTDISGTTIGASTPSTGVFTTLTANTALNYKLTTQSISADSTLTAAMSGQVISNFGATAGKTFTLPACAAGLVLTFITADTDSLMLACASGDSLFLAAGAKPSVEANGTVGEAITLVGMLTTGSQYNWFVISVVGTWSGF